MLGAAGERPARLRLVKDWDRPLAPREWALLTRDRETVRQLSCWAAADARDDDNEGSAGAASQAPSVGSFISPRDGVRFTSGERRDTRLTVGGHVGGSGARLRDEHAELEELEIGEEQRELVAEEHLDLETLHASVVEQLDDGELLVRRSFCIGGVR